MEVHFDYAGDHATQDAPLASRPANQIIMTPFTIKVCGFSTPETVAAAVEAGADMIGLVFHPKSPRFVTTEQAAALAEGARGRVAIVALVVDHDDAALADIAASVRPDLFQAHGKEDGPRIAAIRAAFARPVMKAFGVAEAADLSAAAAIAPFADRIVLDARPPKDAAYPGGHGRPFDWSVLAGLGPDQPFMLSGGLHPGNVAAAIGRIRGMGLALAGVDVSTGVESAPGLKDIAKIRDFIAAAREAAGGPA